MNEESDINLLVSGILDGNNYSHCRVCLESIKEEQFARFHDIIAYSTNGECLALNEVLTKIFGAEVCDKIEGIDAICSGCLNKTLDMYSFIQQYESATQKLHKVLENLTATLDDHIKVTNKDLVMYITCNEEKSQVKLHDILDNLSTTLNDDLEVKKKDSAMYIMCNDEESQILYVKNKERKEVREPDKRVSFKCSACKENFIDLEVLVQHNKNQHSLYTCEKCMYTSTNENDVAEHATSVNFYKCDSCPQFRCTEDSLKDHETGTHRVHVCKECGKSFRGLDKLLVHEQKHLVKNECPKCGKMYTTREFFQKHLRLCLANKVESHPMRSRIVKTYFCQKCDKGYSTPGGLRVHQRFVHGNAEPHICKECGKKFTAPCYLKVHMVTHTKEKNFPCDLCQGRFVSKEALLYHRRRHTGEKPYSCDKCGERFVNASARVEHIKFKHIGPTLSCGICSRKFVTKNILRIHMKKHYNPTNKLYIGRADIPHSVSGDQNVKMTLTGIIEE